MANLNAEQEKLLTDLAAADEEWRNAVITLEERIRAQVAEQVHRLKVKRNLLAFQCDEAKIPVTQISRRGLHTKATNTGYAAIADGATYAPKAASVEQAGPAEFAFEGAGEIRFTPRRQDVAPIFLALGIDEALFDAHPELHSAVFRVDPADGNVAVETRGWIEDLSIRHPVVAMVMGENPSFRQRIIEWDRSQR